MPFLKCLPKPQVVGGKLRFEPFLNPSLHALTIGHDRLLYIWCLQELEAREKRAQKMSAAAAHLMTQRALMSSKGTKRKIKSTDGKSPAVFQWKRQRAK
jgi:hypothetical protein